MSRNRQRVQFSLDAGGIKVLSDVEIKMILRAADELISVGGRSMLVKILKGSKDKKLLEHKLNECPAYGFYAALDNGRNIAQGGLGAEEGLSANFI